MKVWCIATLDTKGQEIDFVQKRLEAAGVETLVVDVGCLGEAQAESDIPRERVFEAAGTTAAEVKQRGDRGEAVTKAADGVAKLVLEAHAKGEVAGVLSVGGSAGTTIGTAAMRALPIGVPKVMVSTFASGNTRPFVRDKDIVMVNPIVDISGLNRISRTVLGEAAAAMIGLVRHGTSAEETGDRPLIGATMFGVTTPCVERARAVLEDAGYEVLVFHATGTGGQAMETLIRDGLIAGVLDITTTELADELVGGVLSAGPERLTAAAEVGIPQVVSVGATDMVNFHGMSSVPESFRERNLYRHNENVTLMRTTEDECRAIGEDIGRKVAQCRGPALILLPRRGVSGIDRQGQPFDDPVAREALFEALKRAAGSVLIELRDEHINDDAFAEAAARRLIEMMMTHAKS
ncbi:MAG: Tm-1-like ATP-binding domain-containing protein [Planctomycetota bacterium]